MGTNSNTAPDAKQFEEETALAAPLDYSIQIDKVASEPVTCHNGKNGLIAFTVKDGNEPYQFQLEKDASIMFPFATNSLRQYSLLSPGNYKVSVKDKDGIIRFIEYELVNPAPITLSLSEVVGYPTCSDDLGTIKVQANGSSNYTYYIEDIYSPYAVNNKTGIFANLVSGNYQLSAVDDNLCYGYLNETVAIAIPAPINFTAVEKQIKCDNDLGSVKLSSLPADAFNVVLENTSTNLFYSAAYTNSGPLSRTYSNLPAGDYKVTVTRTTCSNDSEFKNFNIAAFADVNITTTLPSPHTLSCGGANDFMDIAFTVSEGNSARQVRVVLDDGNSSTEDDEFT
ncbi:MAG TPA: hypothetical protein VJY41_11455, partial [Prolixibacteraceae bacterium]|nr:hypothetical protein [Prolixibacteraceae bacterium]